MPARTCMHRSKTPAEHTRLQLQTGRTAPAAACVLLLANACVWFLPREQVTEIQHFQVTHSFSYTVAQIRCHDICEMTQALCVCSGQNAEGYLYNPLLWYKDEKKVLEYSNELLRNKNIAACTARFQCAYVGSICVHVCIYTSIYPCTYTYRYAFTYVHL